MARAIKHDSFVSALVTAGGDSMACFCDEHDRKRCKKHPEHQPEYCTLRQPAAPAPQAELTVEFSKPSVDNVDFYAPAGMVVPQAEADTSWGCHHWIRTPGCKVCGMGAAPAETAGEMTAQEFWQNITTFPRSILDKLAIWDCVRLDEIIIESHEAFAKQRVEQADADLRTFLERDYGISEVATLASMYDDAAAKVAELERELASAHTNCPADGLEARAESAASELREMREALEEWKNAVDLSITQLYTSTFTNTTTREIQIERRVSDTLARLLARKAGS